MRRPARIAINGLGRIGRSVLRLLAGPDAPAELELVLLNDIAEAELVAYLVEYDSIFGRFPGPVALEAGHLCVAGRRISLSQVADPARLALGGVDILLDCTGKAQTRAWAQAALAVGAGRVLISGPCPQADLTYVMGANDAAFADQRIVSNASCTTNAVAPLLARLDAEFGLIEGHMTTIHCYTGSQPTIDAPRGDFARSRAAALSMIPTTTSAQALTDLVLPGLAGRVTSHSVRVPAASVSAIDLVVRLSARPDAPALNAALQAGADGLIAVTDRPLVSSDLRGRPESLILALPETSTCGEMARLFGWYDNEWGFSSRMVDVARKMAAQL